MRKGVYCGGHISSVWMGCQRQVKTSRHKSTHKKCTTKSALCEHNANPIIYSLLHCQPNNIQWARVGTKLRASFGGGGRLKAKYYINKGIKKRAVKLKKLRIFSIAIGTRNTIIEQNTENLDKKCNLREERICNRNCVWKKKNSQTNATNEGISNGFLVAIINAVWRVVAHCWWRIGWWHLSRSNCELWNAEP